MYLHQSQDPCLPQDRKRRQIHDTFCVPRNCKLQEKRGKVDVTVNPDIHIHLKKKNFIYLHFLILVRQKAFI